jgi:outer membrane lipoprotein-sorting protein
MKHMSRVYWLLLLSVAGSSPLAAQTNDSTTPTQLFGQAINRLTRIVDKPEAEPTKTVSATIKILKADGLPKELAGRDIVVAVQAPDHLLVRAQYDHQEITVCRDGQELWVYEPEKRFGLLGSTNVALFSATPGRKDATALAPLKLPFIVEQVALLPVLSDIETLPAETIDGTECKVLKATPKADAVSTFKLPNFTVEVWIRPEDSLPLRISYSDGRKTDLRLEISNAQFSAPWPEEKWKLPASSADHVDTVARAHLTRFLDVVWSLLNNRIPTLGPATGERRVVAREGSGRLETIDGTRVLFLKGTPEEMGRQQGVLLRKEIRELVDRILYGVGVGSSFEKGRWFIGEIESAQKRLDPFIAPRYDREMVALASAAGLPREEVRLANFFPELFHCSGFAIFGKATVDGRMYHGRILDYLRGMGLEQNAVVTVFQPDIGNAWVNIGYAGFIGSVTAMNEKHVAIGEMGGRGQGNWDGKPMAELVREVMEKANTLDEAIEIMRRGPRTCEYYYVISDAKTKRAAGIAATAKTFETIWPGQSHPQLPHAIADTVLMSAGDRYEELARRVQASYGKLDAESARDLMKRPVCMPSNIHAALFAPDTLDFWVANADSQNPAAHARFTHYNLQELLQPEKMQ